jgi:hypothetical protein
VSDRAEANYIGQQTGRRTAGTIYGSEQLISICPQEVECQSAKQLERCNQRGTNARISIMALFPLTDRYNNHFLLNDSTLVLCAPGGPVPVGRPCLAFLFGCLIYLPNGLLVIIVASQQSIIHNDMNHIKAKQCNANTYPFGYLHATAPETARGDAGEEVRRHGGAMVLGFPRF